MSKHHFISANCMALIVLLFLILGFQNVAAQSQLAQDSYAIFEASCLNCHGPDGAFRETLLMEHSELIDGGTVVPGNPNASELYKRLLGPTENGVQMPFGLPQLPAQSIDTIRRWILAGAPEWTTTRITDGRFISPAEVLTSIESHLTSLEPFDRSFARYFTMTHLYNAGETPEILGEYRKALNKLVNSLSWGSTITNPHPIDPQATIYYIDLRHFEWDVNDGWTKLEAEYPYHIAFDTQTALRAQLTRLQTQMKTDIPSVHIDWFIANASTPPLYHDLLSLPLTDRDLETRLEVDVARNLINAPGVRVWRAGFNNSGVSTNNRVVERHTSRYGAYWKSYDFAGSVGTQNILTNPLSFTHDGGEVVFNLPNGLQGYYLVNASGFRLDDAPINIVSNPAASDPTVRNGISCIGCHTEGMKTFEDEVRSVIESNPSPNYNKAQALRLYVEKSDMDALLEKDMEKFRAALAATGGVFGGVETVSRFHEAFQAPVDAAYAAAVVGLETETFLERVRENTGLQNVGLLALDNANGSVNRDTWTSSFRDVMYALDYPGEVGDRPDITQPDVLPGGHVYIPDSNLRAAVTEALGKNANAPITVDEMNGLKTLDAHSRGISDLTGLQFATNLSELFLRDNQISDLSPIAGLITLRTLLVDDNAISDLSPVKGLKELITLEFKRNRVSDISPVRNLKNLAYLYASNNQISDLSPVAGLTNLKRLRMYANAVSDLSPLMQLINLEWITISDNNITNLMPLAGLISLWHIDITLNNVSDLSPLVGLTNLKELVFVRNDISDLSPVARLVNLEIIHGTSTSVSDLSPLAGLTKLRHLYLLWGDISDLTPLAGLTGLKELYLHDNDISDLAPLAGLTNLEELYLPGNDVTDISRLARLTNLKRLDFSRSELSDISPLAGLSNLKWLNLRDNKVSDISPLAGLTNLTWLDVSANEISDLSPLDELRPNMKFLGIHDNPGFPTGGPKIEGPWLWVALPEARLESGTDLLTEATGGSVTEVQVATHGARVGELVGDGVWTLHTLPSTDRNNIGNMLKGAVPDHGVTYGYLSLYSPREQKTTMYVGNDEGLKVWLNGDLVYEVLGDRGLGLDYNDFFPVTLRHGKNILLVAVFSPGSETGAFFGFEPGTEYAVATGIGYAFSETPIHIGDTFTFDVRAENVSDLAGWQFDIAFDPSRLEALDVNEGDFLKSDGGTTFFQSGRIDNAAGKITGLIAGRISEGGVSGSGSVVQVSFKAKSEGETELALQNFLFGSASKESIPAGPLEIHITVEERLLTGDVNRDGVVNILDLISVAQQLGQSVPANSPVDINGDGVVNIFDLTLVAQGIGGAAAPPARGIDSATIETWIAGARIVDDGSIAFRQGIANLQNLLASLIVPQETALLANYPNPFNPETWIPYQLAAPAEVALTIYDMHGGAVRRLEVGHQAAGSYQSRSRAVYWDGRNGRGESVASGLYFYTLSAGNFTATRKMLIRK